VDRRQTEEWRLVEEIRDEAEGAIARSRGNGRRGAAEASRREGDELDERDLGRELGRAMGTEVAERSERRLRKAAADFEAERFPEAARALKPLAERAADVATVRELYGLTLYRLGHWKLAARELEAFRSLTGSTEQHPVLADCYRALRRWRLVEELWDELRQASPAAELVTEGRIVAAGARADRGDVAGAIDLVGGWQLPSRPRVHHLRRAYVLADLYERAGDVPRARDLFERIRQKDPDFADVRARVRALR
jgi:tetratricopeptide (TPR) repeat protein